MLISDTVSSLKRIKSLPLLGTAVVCAAAKRCCFRVSAIDVVALVTARARLGSPGSFRFLSNQILSMPVLRGISIRF